MALFEIDAGDTAVIYLAEELAEIGTALVPYPSFGDEAWHVACLDNTVREVDILAKAHLGKAAQLLIHIATDAHVERTRVELVELGFSSSTDATSGKKRCHRIADGLLHWCERGMSSIGAAEGDDGVMGVG